ncbi:DegV family protein [Actinomyces wuliandei]|uniref:DegV family protein n=1 Tax=Actinomyces wuliandei TaxID=2057743 RepID=UPI000FDA9D21|nr:DegV family protein [Actinomyces wuliandei]
MTLAVVTDSAACLPAESCDRHGIAVVPLHHTGDGSGDVPSAAGGTPATSRPSVEELEQAYRDAAQRADEVLALHVSGVLSGTVDNARLAASRLNGDRPDLVRVLDSASCSGALALAVLAAAQAPDARRGAALARESLARSHQFFVVDDLRYLARSGRIDLTTARLGGVLGIRPVLSVQPEGIRAVETVRGGARARRHMVAQVVRAAGGTALRGPRRPADPVILTLQAPEPDLPGLREEVDAAVARSGARVSQVLTLPVDKALEVHLGPGATGVAVAPRLLVQVRA